MNNIQRALCEMKSITDSQWKNGMLPHIRFVKGQSGYSPGPDEWEVGQEKIQKDIFETSGITQPPVLAIALEKIIMHKDYTPVHDTEVINLTAAIEKFHDFLLTQRDPYKESIVTLIHPWESGLDNLLVFDAPNLYAKKSLDNLNIEQQIKKRADINNVIAAFRPGEKDYEVYGKLIGFFKKYNYEQKELALHSPFKIQDILYNTILYKAVLALCTIYSHLSKIDKKEFTTLQQKNEQRAQKIEAALSKKLFCNKKQSYFSYDCNASKLIKIESIATLIADICFKEDYKNSLANYQSKQMLHFLSSPAFLKEFDPIKYWRGPVWPVTNWLIIDTLKQKDANLAKAYAKESIAMIAEGFDEKETFEKAGELLYFNLVLDQFTTPSKNQYKHGWLWDSGFSAIGWLYTGKKPKQNIYDGVYAKKKQLLAQGKTLESIRDILKQEFAVALFDEYYLACDYKNYTKGKPLGSEFMSWTAALYMELYTYLNE